MSYTYKYNFISPEIYYAEVKEELRSYFDSGVVDDLMFSKWTGYAVRKMGNSSYRLGQVVLQVKDFEADLPKDFLRIREVYSCQKLDDIVVPSANSIYLQKSYLTNQNLTYDMCRGCVPDCVTIVEKTTGHVVFTFRLARLLHPGNIDTKSRCINEYGVNGVHDFDMFDIHEGKIITKFREGVIYVTYYEEAVDDNFNSLIPDFPEFENYLKSWLRYKIFETIFNNVTDETFNQVQAKLQYYEQKYNEAFIICKTEFMKKTPYQAVRDIRNKVYRRYWELEM